MNKLIMKSVSLLVLLSILAGCADSNSPANASDAPAKPTQESREYHNPISVKCEIDNRGDLKFPFALPLASTVTIVAGANNGPFDFAPILNNLNTPLTDVSGYIVKSPEYTEKYKHWPEWQWIAYQFGNKRSVIISKFYINRRLRLMYDGYVSVVVKFGESIQFRDPESNLIFKCVASD